MTYSVSRGGPAYRMMLPFIAHDWIMGLGLLFTVPGLLDKLLGRAPRLHLA
jgi:hypothetical protein